MSVDNDTSNATTTPMFLPQPMFLRPLSTTIAIGVITSMIAVATTIFNFITLLAFALRKSLRNFGDHFILNLAVADMAIGVLSIPPYIPYLLTGRWTAGRAYCLFWLLWDYITPAASTFNMCVISIDRYLLVAFPIWYRQHQSTRLLLLMMLTPWIIVTLVYGPSILLWELISGQQTIDEGQCYVPYAYNLPFLLFGSTVEFIFPFIVMTTVNFLIFLNIRRRARKKIGATLVMPVHSCHAPETQSRGATRVYPMQPVHHNTIPEVEPRAENATPERHNGGFVADEKNTRPRVSENGHAHSIGADESDQNSNDKTTEYAHNAVANQDKLQDNSAENAHDSVANEKKLQDNSAANAHDSVANEKKLQDNSAANAHDTVANENKLQDNSAENAHDTVANERKLQDNSAENAHDTVANENNDNSQDSNTGNAQDVTDKNTQNTGADKADSGPGPNKRDSQGGPDTSGKDNQAFVDKTGAVPKCNNGEHNADDSGSEPKGRNMAERAKTSEHLESKNTQNYMTRTAAATYHRDRKAARSLFILVFVFTLCWMPYEILALVSAVCPTCIDSTVFEVSFWLLWVNSTINPILYPLLHKRFRDAFFSMMRSFYNCCKSII